MTFRTPVLKPSRVERKQGTYDYELHVWGIAIQSGLTNQSLGDTPQRVSIVNIIEYFIAVKGVFSTHQEYHIMGDARP